MDTIIIKYFVPIVLTFLLAQISFHLKVTNMIKQTWAMRFPEHEQKVYLLKKKFLTLKWRILFWIFGTGSKDKHFEETKKEVMEGNFLNTD